MNMKLHYPSAFPIIGIALTLLAIENPAKAAIVAITSRPAGPGVDVVDWAPLGPEFTTPSNPFTISSNLGFTTTVSKTSLGNFERADEGGFGWTGNFSPGDKLLWTSLTPGPITIDLGVSGFGGGAQIQNDFLGPFVATVEAFNATGTSLGSFNFNGDSTQAGNGTAIFVGVKSDIANIRKLSFNVTGSSSIAINKVSTLPQVPEVGTVFFGWGCVIAWGAGRFRRRPAKLSEPNHCTTSIPV